MIPIFNNLQKKIYDADHVQIYLLFFSPHPVLLSSVVDQPASGQQRRGLAQCTRRRRRAAVSGYVTCWPTSTSSLKGQFE